MITIVCCTNRKGSRTHLFASNCVEQLKTLGVETVNYVNFEDLSSDMLHSEMYSPEGQGKEVTKIQDELLIPAEKFLFVVPEYNGSYPGILKLFLDALSIRESAPTFKGKKACLLGVAAGRAGSLRSMDHLADVLNHLGTVVMPNKLPISQIPALIDENGEIKEDTQEVIKAQIEAFLAF